METRPNLPQGPEEDGHLTVLEIRDTVDDAVVSNKIKKDVVDAEGRKICSLEYEVKRDATDTEFKNIHLKTDTQELDLIGFLDLKKFRGVFLGQRNAHKEGQIVIASLETLFDIGILLHEIGHHQQDDEPKLKELNHRHYLHPIFNDVGVQMSRNDPSLEECDSIFEFFPESKDYFLADAEFKVYYESLQEAGERNKELEDLSDQRLDIESWIKEMSAIDKIKYPFLVRRLKKKLSKLDKLFDDKFREWTAAKLKANSLANIKGNELIRLPIQYLEWDANRRAFRFIQRIKEEVQIDLQGISTNKSGENETIAQHLNTGVERSYGHPTIPGMNFRVA